MQTNRPLGQHSSKFPVISHTGKSEDFVWMQLALQQADEAVLAEEVPIGAVIVMEGKAIATAHNAPISKINACAHAEIQAIEQACRFTGNYRLGQQATLYVTLQPCLMCLGAIFHARMGRVVIGCNQSRYNVDLQQALTLFEQSEAWHPCRFETGCMQRECEVVLSSFFKSHRKQREHSVNELSSLQHLPNVNKNTLLQLELLGYRRPEDLLSRGLEQVANDMGLHSEKLKKEEQTQQAAIFASLCDYFNGETVTSWKQYL